MTMHVLQLGPYPPPVGGVSRNMIAISDELLARGARCSIIATTESGGTDEGPDVYHPRSAFALLRLLMSMKYDVLHLHIGGDVTARVLALAFAAAVFGGGKSVLTLHSGAYPGTKEGISAKPSSVRGFIFRRFRRIIAVNEAIAQVFRNYGVVSERLSVIAPFSLTLPDESVIVPTRLANFCLAHEPMLLAVGGLEADYDPLFQVDAMRDILLEFPNAGLMIVGDGSMRDAVEKAVDDSGCGEHICLAGNLDHAITLHLIKDADILLRTTKFDGDAISVREALFLGTPVIATDTGSRPEGVHLIAIGNKHQLLEKIRSATAAKPPAPQTPDNTNIAKVIELYNQLI